MPATSNAPCLCRDVLGLSEDVAKSVDEDVKVYLTNYVFDSLALSGSSPQVSEEFAKDLYELCEAYAEGSAAAYERDPQEALRRLERFVEAKLARESEASASSCGPFSISSPPSSLPSEEAIDTITASFCSRSDSDGASSPSGSTHFRKTQQHEPCSTAYEDERLSILRGLVPCEVVDDPANHDLDDLLAHLLEVMSMGSMEDAAKYLLEASDAGTAVGDVRANCENLRKAAELRKEAEQLQALELKRRTLNRFDLEKEPLRGGGGGEKRKERAGPVKYAGEADASKIRFLDGKVVSTKGEKFIIEKLKEDWDGGSKGRVKTKGKRGAGWVG